MPDLIKIGYTMETAEERANRLSKLTAIPMPFEVVTDFAQLELEQCRKLEQEIHKELADFRVNPSREFFKYPADDASQLLKKLYTSFRKEFRRPRWLKWIPSF